MEDLRSKTNISDFTAGLSVKRNKILHLIFTATKRVTQKAIAGT